MRSEEFNPLRIKLIEDVYYFEARLTDKADRQIIRRSYVRSVFAFIEGYLYAFRRISLRMSEENEGIKLKLEENNALKEIEVSTSLSGKINERSKYISPKNSVAFSISAIAKQHEANFTLRKNGQEWESYLAAQKIRNRLMHPKNHTDLHITDTELGCVEISYKWFTSELRRLEEAIAEAIPKAFEI